MRLFGIIAAFGLSLVLTGSTKAADRTKQAGEKTQYIFGTVTEVKQANGKDDGSITIKTFARPGKTGSEKTIRVTKSTRFEKGAGTAAKKSVPSKKNVNVKATKHRSVRAGKHIVIIVRGDKHHAARKMDVKSRFSKMVAAKKKAQAVKVNAKKAAPTVSAKKGTKVKKAGVSTKTSKVVKKTAGVKFDAVKAGDRVLLMVHGDSAEGVRILSLPQTISKTTK